MFDYFSMFVRYLPRLLEGLRLTLLIAVFGILIAIVLGVLVCIFSISKQPLLNRIANNRNV